MMKLLAEDARDVFLSARCRQFLAAERFKTGGAVVRTLSDPSAAVMPGTVVHNRLQIDDASFASARRTLRLINPLTSIESVYRDPFSKQVLSIGPRTEMELIHLVGAGFDQRNIFAVDLISTSPWIDIGDMHALHYPDRSFDIVISSWVLAYSSDPKKAVSEMIRVTRDGGIIAIGNTFNPKASEVDYKVADEKIVGTVFRKVGQYEEMLRPHLQKIYFQDEPERDDVTGAVILIGSVTH